MADLANLFDAASKAADVMAAAAQKIDDLSARLQTAEANSVDPVALQAMVDSINQAVDILAKKVT